jgi:site-specific recombinase XerD
MASIFIKTGSPYWQIKYLAEDNVWRNVSSKIRHDQGRESKRKAMALCAEYTRRESPSARARVSEKWESWVFDYFDRRHGIELDGENRKAKTRMRARAAWNQISSFLDEHKIRTPRQLTYEIAAKYIDWRTTERKGMRKAHHNTAVVEFRFLSSIMKEAVKRGFTESNCIRDVEVRRIPGKQKDCLTAAQKSALEARISDPATPQWMREHWLVLTRQGCRCKEAFVPMREISESTGTMRLELKGGKMFTVQIHPDICPLIATARAEKRTHLITPQRNAPKIWWNFFRECEIEASIHWVRVTVITQMIIAGYTTAQVCAYIGHSEEVNRIYQRVHPHQITPPKW